jgi:MFS family permease
MLQELDFSYLELTLATACVVAAKFLLLPTWGHLIDARGPRRIYPLALFLVAVVPLPWIVANGLLGVAVAQAFSGASWACYEIAYFSVLLDATFKRTRPQVFVAQAVLNGSAQLLGSLLGAALVAATGASFRGLFVASTAARLLVALAALPLIPDVARSAVAGSTLVLRTIGIRAHGGPVHRPVPLDGDSEDGD